MIKNLKNQINCKKSIVQSNLSRHKMNFVLAGQMYE